jgi:hypothetical protein
MGACGLHVGQTHVCGCRSHVGQTIVFCGLPLARGQGRRQKTIVCPTRRMVMKSVGYRWVS